MRFSIALTALVLSVFASTVLQAQSLLYEVSQPSQATLHAPLPSSLNNAEERAVFISPEVKQLMELSGMKELLQQIPDSTASSFEEVLDVGDIPKLLQELHPDDMRQAVLQAFNEAQFEKTIASKIASTLGADDVNEMISWYSSQLGKRIRHAETTKSLLNAHAAFVEYQQKLKDQPPSLSRAKLAERLDDSMKTTESAVEMMINMQIAFNLSLGVALPEERRLNTETIITLANQEKPKLLDSFRRNTRELLLFIYNDFNDAELRTFKKVLDTEAGQGFLTAINSGINTAMFDASLALGESLSRLVLDKKKVGFGI